MHADHEHNSKSVVAHHLPSSMGVRVFGTGVCVCVWHGLVPDLHSGQPSSPFPDVLGAKQDLHR
jgi:hypothetical protein